MVARNEAKRSPSARRAPRLALGDLRAGAALAHRASEGVIDITEGLHQSVRATLGLPAGASPDRCGGLAGGVYAAVRAVHALVGSGVERGLRQVERLRPLSAEDVAALAHDPKRLAWLAALNGVCGDHLHDSGNTLAFQPCLRHLDDSAAPAASVGDRDDTRLVVMVHGLCMNELQWRSRGDRGHGDAIAQALGARVLYFRYNTGRSIADNGLALAQALEALGDGQLLPRRISLVGHSMGGLVARSAERHARTAGSRWHASLRDLVLLGAPNDGAPLERIGHAFERVLGGTPFAHHFTRLGALRSRGILDLRHGELGVDRAGSLPDGLRCLAVAGVLSRRPDRAGAGWVGDGLVPVDSALGRAAFAGGTRAAADELVVEGCGHLQLLRSTRVRERVTGWLDGA